MEALQAVSRWAPQESTAGVIQFDPSTGSTAVRAVTGNDERVFAWASVTKLCTALAALVAMEEGTISLEDPVGPPGSTVRHLLAHASGLGPEEGPPVAEPGKRRIYSNAGFEVLALHLADRSGIAFADYLGEAVFEPLSMRTATLGAGASAAHGVAGSLQDLLALGAEFLAPRLIAQSTRLEASSVAFPGLVGVLPGFGFQDPCDWGLGLEIKDAKSPHWTGSTNSARTFGHFGQSGSFLWVDPMIGTACASLSDMDFGAWSKAEWPAFSDAVVAEIGR